MSIRRCPKSVKTVHDKMREPHNTRLPHEQLQSMPCELPITVFSEGWWWQVEEEDSLVCVLLDEVESLTRARSAAVSGSEPADAIRAVNALLTQVWLFTFVQLPFYRANSLHAHHYDGTFYAAQNPFKYTIELA